MTLLTSLRDNIENMEKIHQVHILKIFKKYNVEYTENTNGIFINMSILKDEAIAEIKSYIEYVKLQQKQLEKVEAEKESYKKEFYKDNKAVATYN
tara:strand:+ start:337 stop:621 length:285 start_codon:yes stop_codon:yes gene_type:complete